MALLTHKVAQKIWHGKRDVTFVNVSRLNLPNLHGNTNRLRAKVLPWTSSECWGWKRTFCCMIVYMHVLSSTLIHYPFCVPKVAILIPFRNRHEHLPILLRHLVPVLQKQRLQFAFYLIEQVCTHLTDRFPCKVQTVVDSEFCSQLITMSVFYNR